MQLMQQQQEKVAAFAQMLSAAQADVQQRARPSREKFAGFFCATMGADYHRGSKSGRNQRARRRITIQGYLEICAESSKWCDL